MFLHGLGELTPVEEMAARAVALCALDDQAAPVTMPETDESGAFALVVLNVNAGVPGWRESVVYREMAVVIEEVRALQRRDNL